MKIKSDAKLTCFFQNWRKQFDKFWHEHSKVSNIFTLIGSLWEKYISIELKKYRRVIFHETEEGFKLWKGIHLSFQNWHKEFDKFWPEHSKVSRIFTLMGSFWAKYILFELKKYRGVIFHDIEEWCKIWRKTDLLLGKWHEEFGKFSPEHLKVSKLGLWWDPFVQSRKGMTLKFAEELCVMKTKNNAKFEEELSCNFKTGMSNLTNFDSNTQKSKKKCSLIGSFDQSIYCLS